MGKHRYALYDAGIDKIVSVTEALDRAPAPAPVNRDGFSLYYIQAVEDDAPVSKDVPEVELVPPGHVIWHTRRKAG